MRQAYDYWQDQPDNYKHSLCVCQLALLFPRRGGIRAHSRCSANARAGPPASERELLQASSPPFRQRRPSQRRRPDWTLSVATWPSEGGCISTTQLGYPRRESVDSSSALIEYSPLAPLWTPRHQPTNKLALADQPMPPNPSQHQQLNPTKTKSLPSRSRLASATLNRGMQTLRLDLVWISVGISVWISSRPVHMKYRIFHATSIPARKSASPALKYDVRCNRGVCELYALTR